jgi:hypothetical protein
MMSVAGMLRRQWVGGAGRGKIDEPEPVGGVMEADDSGDTVFDEAGILAVEQNVVAYMVAELSERKKRLAEIGLDRDGTSIGIECDGKMREVKSGVVGHLHDLAVGDPNAKAVGSRCFVDAGGGASDQAACATGVKNSSFRRRSK